MRRIVSFAVRRPVTVTMTALAVVAFGAVGFSRLALELFPDLSYPSITVQTDFPDTAPEEVENLVTRPVEEAVGVLRGLQSIHSVSRSGASEVTLEFEWGSNMDLLSMEVREKLDRLILPDEAEDPIVLRFDPSLDPIVRLALAGGEDLRAMRYFAEHKVKTDFETIKGVASAQVKGGLEEEIQIEIDQERLAALEIPIDRIRQVVEASNLNLPGGALRGRDEQYLIRTINEFDDLEEIENLIVWQQGSASVRLREVATVSRGAKDRVEITRLNGVEAVELALYKEGDANTVHVAHRIREKLDEWERKLPPGHELVVLFDQSHFIEAAVDGVRDAALVGGLLAIAVLFLFLRDLRSTLIIGLSIPLSVIATFMVMYRADISLNLMSLGGLTLGIGMLVDNSIVVLESIFRHRQQGLDIRSAAVTGTSEVGAAVAASTLTTVAVFLPIVFVEGIAGQMFRDQAWTVTISLLASFAVAITVIPMLSAAGSRRRSATATANAPDSESLNDPAKSQTMTLGVLSRLYDRVLRLALRLRFATVLLAFSCLFLSIWSLQFLGQELIPQLREGKFYFEVNLPEGTSLEASDRTIGELNAAAAKHEAIANTYSTAGSRLVAGGMSLNTRGEHLGQLNFVLNDEVEAAEEETVIASLRDEFADVPDLEIKFGRPSYFSLRTPIEVVVFGEELDDLRAYSVDLAESLAAIPGLVDVRSSLEAGNPELQVAFNRDRLAASNLDIAPMSATLKNRVLGVVPTRFKEEDRQIDIRIRNRASDRASVGDVERLIVPGAENAPTRLLTWADVVLDRGPAEVHRVQQQRAAVITASVRGRSLGAAINDVEAFLANHEPPEKLSTEVGGQNREMQVSFASLRFALLLAVFLVYLVMASTFESFLHPLIVLATVPLALIGVTAGLHATSTPISVIVLIGSVMLVGIVVNNSIILVDTIRRLRARGAAKMAAIIEAGHIRLRPIVMTTLTTVLGILPMAIAWGDGAELRAPLAITVASGLILATGLTLIVIPAVYALVPSHVACESESPVELSDDAS